MSRSKVGAASEGMVPAPKEGAAEAADSTQDLVSMMKTMMNDIGQIRNEMGQMKNQIISCVDRLELKMNHIAGKACVEEDMSGERSRPAAEDGVIRNTPFHGTHTLPSRPHEEQQSTGHQEEEQDQAPAPRPGDCIEEGSHPDGESIRRGLVYDTASMNPYDTETSNLVQKRHIGQPETNLAPVSRPNELTLRDPLRSESLKGEPVSRTVKYPSSKKRRPPRRLTCRRDGVFRLR